jgi:hypothetical protein
MVGALRGFGCQWHFARIRVPGSTSKKRMAPRPEGRGDGHDVPLAKQWMRAEWLHEREGPSYAGTGRAQPGQNQGTETHSDLSMIP